MISKKKFKAYVVVQKSGLTNMLHIKNVKFAANGICDVKLSREDCLEIMKNYSILKEMYSK